MTWWVWLSVGLVAVGVAAVGLAAFGARRWAAEVSALQAGLARGRLDPTPGPDALPTRYDARELEGLPAPVQRYFRTGLTDGQPLITAATIDMAGTFNLSATGEQWKPFTSRQRVFVRRPGFLWDARIAMAPGVTVRVVHSYVAGRGLLRAKVLGLVTMAEQQGDGEIARGEFMRWFAEMPWYPTALLPSQGVRCSAVDEHSANATIVDGPVSLALLWIRAEGRKPYFVGTITALAFEFAR